MPSAQAFKPFGSREALSYAWHRSLADDTRTDGRQPYQEYLEQVTPPRAMHNSMLIDELGWSRYMSFVQISSTHPRGIMFVNLGGTGADGNLVPRNRHDNRRRAAYGPTVPPAGGRGPSALGGYANSTLILHFLVFVFRSEITCGVLKELNKPNFVKMPCVSTKKILMRWPPRLGS
jgi:hypothetical protein